MDFGLADRESAGNMEFEEAVACPTRSSPCGRLLYSRLLESSCRACSIGIAADWPGTTSYVTPRSGRGIHSILICPENWITRILTTDLGFQRHLATARRSCKLIKIMGFIVQSNRLIHASSILAEDLTIFN
jgi:hypothetical protein